MERITFPEGVTEGRESLLWHLPPAAAGAQMGGGCDLDAAMTGHATHIGLDALNRGTGDVDLQLSVEAGTQTVAHKHFRLHEWSNQRLLLPLPHAVQAQEFQLRLMVAERAEATVAIFTVLSQSLGFSMMFNTYTGYGNAIPLIGPVMAASVLMTLPVILIFFVGQKYFVLGISTTGMAAR